MSKGDNTYFFIKDLQGDIRKIIDENGTVVATYAYDAWGALLAENEDSSVEGLNPFRYRGYVYDHETQLYYLQSRYYDPKTGRFINADDPEYTDTYSGSPQSTNMFAYCENNAPNEEDPSGYWNKEESKKKGHPTLSKKFSSTVKEWVYYADSMYNSDNDNVSGNNFYCSEPFHSRRNALEIFKYIYNKAVQIKKENKKVNFYFSKNKNKEKENGCLYYKYFAAQLTKSKENDIPKNLLNNGYLFKIDDKYFTYYNNKSIDLRDRLTKLDRIKQPEALLGLALHVLQDYYAHVIEVPSFMYYKDGKGKGKKKTPDFSLMTKANYLITPGRTGLIEDNPDFLSWRFDNALKASNIIKKCYSNNEIINTISCKQSSIRKTTFFIMNPKGTPSLKYQKPKKNYDKYVMNYYYTSLNIVSTNSSYRII